MKDLNLKKMIKNMTLLEKAKLLFADRNRRYDTSGKDRLLTPEEEDCIIHDCQEKRQIAELNRLGIFFDLAGLAVIDVHIATLSLELAVSRIDMLVLGMYLYNSSKNKEESGVKGELYSLFDINVDDDEFSDPDEERAFYQQRQPNHWLQKVFCLGVKAYQDLMKAVHAVNHVSEKAGIDLLSERNRSIMVDAEKELKDFQILEGFLKVLKLYQMLLKQGLIKQEEYKEPLFLELLLDFEKVIVLTEEDKRSVEEDVRKVVERNL